MPSDAAMRLNPYRRIVALYHFIYQTHASSHHRLKSLVAVNSQFSAGKLPV